MRARVIAVPCIEGTPGDGGRLAGLAAAADAFAAAGVLDEIAAGVLEITGRDRLELAADEIADDPIVDLGRLNAAIAGAVSAAIVEGAVPLLAGGTCNHLIGILAGLQAAYGPASRIGLVWFDAHGDFNTPRTTRSGMLGGMPVAVAAGLCHAAWRDGAGQTVPLPTDRILMVDVRDLDPEEAALIAATDVRIARFGPDGSITEIAAAVDVLVRRVDHCYLHVDADVLDASEQPNHPTAEPDGPSLAATSAAIERVMATGKVRAFGVVSVNPTGDGGETSLRSGAALLRAGAAAWAAAAAGV